MNNADMPAMPVAKSYLPKGVTKREYFAGLAMQGLLAAYGEHDAAHMDEIASDAVMAADALLAELERTGGGS